MTKCQQVYHIYVYTTTINKETARTLFCLQGSGKSLAHDGDDDDAAAKDSSEREESEVNDEAGAYVDTIIWFHRLQLERGKSYVEFT